MPVLEIQLQRLFRLVGAPPEQLLEKIPYIGLDIEGVEGDVVRVEYSPNRPDFSTDYGVARTLQGIFGFKTGAPLYRAKRGSISVLVDSTVKQVRPYIVAGVVRGLRLNEEDIRQLISMQEDLHMGLGRRRKLVAIGLHKLDPLKTPIRYTTAAPSFQFTPLGYDQAMTMKEVLTLTKQGREYGHLLKDLDRYPLLVDNRSQVLSFPPIINGVVTAVDVATRNLFIDITATDLEAAEACLNIVVTTLADMGGQLEAVEVRYGKRSLTTPSLTYQEMPLDVNMVRRFLGLKLSEAEAINWLERCRLTATKKRGELRIRVPPYRVDIMHPVDLVEEAAIGYGYENLNPTLPFTRMVGGPSLRSKALFFIQDALIGLGFIEVMGYSLVSEELEDFLQPPRKLKVEAPKSREHSVLRSSLLPTLLSLLAKNKDEEYPQRIFEVGTVFAFSRQGSFEVKEEVHVAALTAHKAASFTEARGVAEAAILHALAKHPQTSPCEHPLFAPGRAASLTLDGDAIGVVGEVRPELLFHFGLEVPVTGFEASLERFLPPPAIPL